ncbi:ABC transporter substrate-binding protein [Dactylosporangium sp. CA-152071]|uniref:ABC transporter substrate-binding protein n=1 Tax=Dactylosporangium sp. CA-152071 TaxID=3239933 RepID=UPI003D8C9BC5
MRQFRTLAAAATALSLLAAAGCGSTPASGEGAAGEGAPVAGGTFNYAIDSEPSCLDPHVSLADATAFITRGVVDSLVVQDADGSFKPWLAKSWKVSDDLKTYTFDLRTDVTFHDGTKFDAAAVKANFDRIVAKETKSQYASTLIGPYTGTTVVDEHTAEVRFSAPFQPFLQAASTAYLGIQSPKAFTDYAGALCEHVVGSGPFVFTSHTRQQNVTLTRSATYTSAPPNAKHAGPAHLDKVVIRFLSESATRLGTLTSGEVQGISAVPVPNVAAVQADTALQLVRTDAQGAVYTLYPNTSRAPFDDEKVRKAFQQALDVDTLVKSVYFGQYKRAWGVLSPNTKYYEPSLEQKTKYDEAAANKLLDEAGWTTRDADGYRTKNGKRLAVVWPYTQQQAAVQQRGTFAQAVQAAQKKIGIEVVRTSVQTAELFGLVAKAQYDIFDESWTRADPDLLRIFFASTSKPLTGQNISWVNDATVDGWVNGASATADDAKRKDAYSRTQLWVQEHAAAFPVYVPAYLLAASTKVHGLRSDPASFPLLYDVWLTK